ncbi:MAG: hypothetical protein NVS2B14_10180 [Chamaesiphon sp.]
MATIAISDIYPAGSDLFMDYETFMTDLTDSELNDVSGGSTPAILGFIAASSAGCGAVASAIVTGVAYTIWGHK